MRQEPESKNTKPTTEVGEWSTTPNTPPSNDLTPVDVIRTETVFSRLPIHNLAKQRRVNIQIEKKTPDGQVELKWEVSYSDRYGQARALAYKLDTIIVDPAVEEAGKPLPDRIRLGSLHDICKDLGITEGENKNKIKKAFLQNAFTGIVAKFKYTANDKTIHTFEAGFTRYSVIFTGQKFPDGTKADAVYITLNPDYREVLNNAPWRPLSLDYKKQLAPAPQRLYEILSFKIYNALRFNLPTADLLYSDYCQASTQQRYFDYDHFKKQMYKIHKPHQISGYIVKVEYKQTKDELGNVDWLMRYTPGARARAEYNLFNPGRKVRTLEATQSTTTNPIPTRERGARKQPRQRRLDLRPEVDVKLLSELTSRGVGETAARKLLAKFSSKPILDLLQWGDSEIANQPGKINNPPGFYIHLLEEFAAPPPSFISPRQADDARAVNEAKHLEQINRQAEEDARAEAEKQQLDLAIDMMNPADQLQLRIEAEAVLSAGKNFVWVKAKEGLMPKATVESLVRSQMRKLLKDRQASRVITPTQVLSQEIGLQPTEPPMFDTTQLRPAFDAATSKISPATDIPQLTFNLEPILSTPQLPAPQAKPVPDHANPIVSNQLIQKEELEMQVITIRETPPPPTTVSQKDGPEDSIETHLL